MRWHVGFTDAQGEHTYVGSGETLEKAKEALTATLAMKAAERAHSTWSFEDALDELRDKS